MSPSIKESSGGRGGERSASEGDHLCWCASASGFRNDTSCPPFFAATSHKQIRTAEFAGVMLGAPGTRTTRRLRDQVRRGHTSVTDLSLTDAGKRLSSEASERVSQRASGEALRLEAGGGGFVRGILNGEVHMVRRQDVTDATTSTQTFVTDVCICLRVGVWV
jgi:hypothetical protein